MDEEARYNHALQELDTELKDALTKAHRAGISATAMWEQATLRVDEVLAELDDLDNA